MGVRHDDERCKKIQHEPYCAESRESGSGDGDGGEKVIFTLANQLHELSCRYMRSHMMRGGKKGNNEEKKNKKRKASLAANLPKSSKEKKKKNHHNF